jgi:hypothetical protein
VDNYVIIPHNTWTPTTVNSSTSISINNNIIITGINTNSTVIINNAYSTLPITRSGPYIRYYNNTITGTRTETNGLIYTAIQTGSYIYSSSNDIYVEPIKRRKINYREIRIKKDYAKKALWKSIKLFENLFGINQIQLFMNGQSFEIEGRRFNYRISKNSSVNLLDHTSRPTSCCIPYRLEILNKNGLILFEGCTIFKNTPVVDQIIALILHIQNDEEFVLLNMNLSNLTSEFLTCNKDIQYINKLKGKNYELRS